MSRIRSAAWDDPFAPLALFLQRAGDLLKLTRNADGGLGYLRYTLGLFRGGLLDGARHVGGLPRAVRHLFEHVMRHVHQGNPALNGLEPLCPWPARSRRSLPAPTR